MYYKIMYKKPSAVWVESKIIDNKIDPNYNNALYIECLDDRYRKLDCEIKQNGEIIDELTDYTANGSFGWLKQNVVYSDDTGVPFIRIKNITEDGFDFGDLVYINTESYDKLKKSKLNGGELLFSKTGSVGTTLVVPSNINKMSLADNIFKVIYKPNIDTYYIDAFFKSYYGKLWVKRLSQGGVQQTIIKNSFREIKIPIPSPEIQKYIGDKVRKAEELREEAKRLKKEAEEIFNQNYEVISKNNSKFEWVSSYYLNEDNVIPNFYKQYQLLRDKKYVYIEFENIVESIKCGIPVRSDMRIGDIYPFYGASGVTDNIGDYNFDGEYLIVAQDGSIGSVNVARNKFWANNHVWVVKVKNGWDLEFLELYLNRYNYWISLTTGSVVPKVTSENLKKLLVPKINYEVQKSIGDKIREAKHKEQRSKALIEQAKQDVEDLIEGNFSMK